MAITFVGAGTAASSSGGSTGSLTPTLPSGLQDNDLVLIYCTGRGINYVFTSPNYTQKWSLDHSSSTVNTIVLLYKKYATGDANPVVSWTGGAANATVIMQVCAFHGVDLTTPFNVQGATSSCVSQQNIGAITGITTGASGKCTIVFGHKAGDWTTPNGVATLTGDSLTWYEIGEPTSKLGTDAGAVWDYAIHNGSQAIANKTFTVTGGEAQYGMGVMQSLNEAGAAPKTITIQESLSLRDLESDMSLITRILNDFYSLYDLPYVSTTTPTVPDVTIMRIISLITSEPQY